MSSEILEQGERGHDFALQERFTLDKASRPALRRMGPEGSE